MGIISKLTIILLCFYKSQQFKKPGGYQNLEILLDEFDIDNPYIVKSHKMEEAQYAKIRKKMQSIQLKLHSPLKSEIEKWIPSFPEIKGDHILRQLSTN